VSELDQDKKYSMEEYFFGSVTVGERGQVVIPAEARKRLDINPGDKLLVMGHPYATGLVIAKIDSLREFITVFQQGLQGVESQLSFETSNGTGEHK